MDDVDHIGAWQIELRKKDDDPMELDEVILHVQLFGEVDERSFIKIIHERFKTFTEFIPNEIRVHTPAEMRILQGIGEELKEKRVVDHCPRDGKPVPARRGGRIIYG